MYRNRTFNVVIMAANVCAWRRLMNHPSLIVRATMCTSQRTRLTEELWAMRSAPTGFDKPTHIKKQPRDSYVRAILPFLSDPLSRSGYVSFDGGVRMGVLLEDLDAAAGTIAHIHCDDNRPDTMPLTLVTLSCDRIDMMSSLSFNDDISVSGAVTWVGRSTLEVTIDLRTVCSTPHDADEHYDNFLEDTCVDNTILRSKFIMAARYEGKAAEVNELVISNDAERCLWMQGERANALRKERRDDVMKNNTDTLFTGKSVRVKRPEDTSISLSATHQQSISICQPQDRNKAGKIFGGYLMRKAFELAVATAYMTTGTKMKPIFLGVDDVTFLRPVSIGDLAIFDAYCVYSTNEGCIQIRVQSQVVSCSTGEHAITNVYHYSFVLQDLVPSMIFAQTNQEHRLLEDGKRRLKDRISASRLAVQCISKP